MPVIATRRLSKRFGRTLAVDDLSLRVEEGQVFGFLGPNGSGKTTTIGMLLGIVTPSAGEVSLFGLKGRKSLHEARQRIGATLDLASFYPYLTGRDNLRIVANLKGARPEHVDEVLRRVGLQERRRTRFDKYSLGMKQRLAVGAALLGEPELLVLDEPMNGLDPDGMREMREIIADLAGRGRTIFLSSHLLNEVERSCTHVAILSRGRIVRQASVRDLLTTGLTVEIEADEPERLRLAALEYAGTASASRSGAAVLVRLEDEDVASLNRFLADRGIYASRISPHKLSLEEAFMEATRTAGSGSEADSGGAVLGGGADPASAAGEEAP